MSVAVEVMMEAPVVSETEISLPSIIVQVHQLTPAQQQSLLDAVIVQGGLWPKEDDPAQSNDELDAELKELLRQTRQLSMRKKQLLIEVLSGHGFQPPDSWLRSRTIRTDAPFADHLRELDWIEQHGKDYVGEWVAVCGDQLVAHSKNAKEVFAKARECEAMVSFMHPSRVSDLPYIAL
ncbi:MAG: hypothetical protein HOP19_27610 [Acidobacteria bacterium]|nr:hypothetical protein [Acidobacteriota bacterium]